MRVTARAADHRQRARSRPAPSTTPSAAAAVVTRAHRRARPPAAARSRGCAACGGSSLLTRTSRTSGKGATAARSAPSCTCSVLMRRAASSAPRGWRAHPRPWTPRDLDVLDRRPARSRAATSSRRRRAPGAQQRHDQPTAAAGAAYEITAGRGRRRATASDRPSEHGERASHRLRSSTPRREPTTTRESAPAPSVCTSGSSSTPKRSSTRRRPSRHQLDDVGGRRGAGVLDEVGVLGRKARAARPPGRCSRPRTAAARRCVPRRADRSGFLNVEPNVLMPCGCASWRRPRISRERRLDAARGRRRGARKDARATISPGRRLELAVAEAQLLGRAALGARRRVDDLRPLAAPAPARRRRRWRSCAPRRRRCRGC